MTILPTLRNTVRGSFEAERHLLIFNVGPIMNPNRQLLVHQANSDLLLAACINRTILFHPANIVFMCNLEWAPLAKLKPF